MDRACLRSDPQRRLVCRETRRGARRGRLGRRAPATRRRSRETAASTASTRSCRSGPPNVRGGTPANGSLGDSGGCWRAEASTTSPTTAEARAGFSSAYRTSGGSCDVIRDSCTFTCTRSSASWTAPRRSPALVDACGRTRDARARAHRPSGAVAARSASTRRARKAGIKPIVGCEVVVETAGILGDEADLPPERASRAAGERRASGARRRRATTSRCSAATSTGYRNLCRLLSRTHLRGPHEPSHRHACATSSGTAEGLIGLSGCGNGEAAMRGARARARTGPRGASAARGVLRARATSTSSSCTRSPPTARGSSAGWRRSPTNSACRSWPPTTSTTCAREDHRLHDVLSSRGRAHGAAGTVRPAQRRAVAQARAPRCAACSRGCRARATPRSRSPQRCELELPLGEFHFPAADIPRGETPYSVLAKVVVARARAAATGR